MHWIYLPLFSLLVTVFPSIPPSSGPAEHSYLRRGCVCWIAESPFVGGCPYLLRSTTFRQLVAKGGTLGRSTVACCVFTAIIRIAATLADFLKASRPALLCLQGQRPQLLDRVQVWKSWQGEQLLRPNRGNAGTEMWLSAISERRGVQSWLWSSMTQRYRPVPVTQQLRSLWGWEAKYCEDDDSAKVLEKLLQRWDQYSPLAELLIIILTSDFYKTFVNCYWSCGNAETLKQISAEGFIRLLHSAAFKVMLHVRAVIQRLQIKWNITLCSFGLIHNLKPAMLL